MCATFSLYSLVNRPTRYGGTSTTQIDICLTNCEHITSAGTIGANLSDHLPIFAVKKLHRNDRNILRENVRIRSYADYTINGLSESLLCQDWEEYYYKIDNVDAAWDYLFNEMLRNADYYAPFRTINRRASTIPWYTVDLLQGAIERDRLFAIARKAPSPKNIKAARRQRNLIKGRTEDARNVYYRNLIEKSRGDPREYWANVNELMGKSKSGKITNVMDTNTNELASTEKSVDLNNEYFTSIGRLLDDKLPQG